MGADDVVAILISTDGGTTWASIQAWTAASNVTNTSSTFTYDLSAVTSSNVKFAFYANEGADDAEDYNFYFDNFTVSNALGTNEIVAQNPTVKVYPNPFRNVVRISEIKDIISASVTDMAGRTVKIIRNPGTSIDLSELSSGMYILTISTKEGKQMNAKIIKK